MKTRFSFFHTMIGIFSLLVFTAGAVLTGCSLFSGSPQDPLQASGITLEHDNPSIQTVSTPQQASPYPFRAQTDNYDSLSSPDARNLYHAMEQQAWGISQEKHAEGYYSLGQITMDGNVGEEHIRMAVTAFKNDHPEVFWLANVYSKAYSENHTIVRLYSYVSADECARMLEQIDQKVQEILYRLPAGLSELDREIFLFDEIASLCTYDTAAAKDPSLWQSYTIYGLLINGKAVCEGYARTMQLLLSYADMECRLMNGEAGGTVHMWNLVRVDGNWYHLDPTWNDETDVPRYDYFNVTDAVIGKDHTPSVDITTLPAQQMADYLNTGHAAYNLPMPACVADQANYLKQKGVLISGFTKASETRVVSALVEAAQNDKPAVYLYIGEGLNYSMAVNKLFNTSPYQLADYVEQANRKLDDKHQIRYDRITYILGENSRGITVRLAY